MNIAAQPQLDSDYLDVSDPSFVIHSQEVHDARERNWFARTNYGLAILRYEEMKQLLRHPKLRQGSAAWPRHNGVTEGPFSDWWNHVLLNLEGSDHARLRRLVNPAFSPKMLEKMNPRFQALAEELIDAMSARGHCEFMSEFAEPYAARVICIMLGLPETEWKKIAGWSSTLGLALGVTLKQDLPRIEKALEGLYQYADQLIDDRLRDPGEDFVTRLVLAQRDDDAMSRDELRVMLVLLIFGGMDTTRNQLGLAMESFMQHPEQWELLAERPELSGNAVAEVMRTNPTVTWVTREAVEDFEYQGLSIAKGTTVHLFSQAAGTDPRAMPSPEFNIAEEHPPHFGFGGGAHHCLGHFIAKSDMSIALPLLAKRLCQVRLDGDATWLPRSGNTGPVTMPLAFRVRA
ncbi:cytochrome P450 [Litchfieldella qijiaojingensis]|uniref:Cytochrome P450 n=1 Tax=Litchfieldella qijiaojingensis TaxID=980347 RepID=A0ABQ2YZ78_9GAMM|nr:cytochrome P450 [Halomonas qijiaojingensis]GGX98651.1 cytochrome P450 [Halomonas qijiaojingensis]